MTNPIARDLIQRLVDEMELWIFDAEVEDIDRAHCLVDEALAYLAQPEPDEPAVPAGREPASVAYEPSDEELKATYWEAFKNSAACGAEQSWIAGLRAVACHGHQRPAPIPLSERQSEPEGPTDEESDEFFRQWRDTNTDAESWLTVEQERRLARAVLAHWGSR